MGILTAENKTLEIGILPFCKDPMIKKLPIVLTCHSLSKLGRFNLLLQVRSLCLQCHKLRTKLIIKIGMIYRNKSTGSLPYQFIK